MNTLLTNNVTAETNVYYDALVSGLWFAEIGIWYRGEYVMGITRGGYTLQSSAKAQATRLYSQRFQIVSDFSNEYNAEIDVNAGKVVSIGKVDMWKRDNGNFAIRYACDTRTEEGTQFTEMYQRALELATNNYSNEGYNE